MGRGEADWLALVVGEGSGRFKSGNFCREGRGESCLAAGLDLAAGA